MADPLPYNPAEFPNMGNFNVYNNEPTPSGRQTQSFTQPAQQPWYQNPQMQAGLLGAGTSIVGGYLSQRNQNQQNSQNNDAAMQRLELQLQMEREQREREMLQRQKELALQTANQVPQRQDWRQRQALMSAMLPGARNYQVTPPGDLARFTPQMSGGLRIPEGGFDQSTLDRAGSVASGGNYSTPDYGRAGYGSAAGNLQQENQSYSDKLKQQALQQTAQLGSQSQLAAQRQTQSNVGANAQQNRNQGPSTGQRIGQAALQAGLGYLGARYGGTQGGQQMNPWLAAGLSGAGALF
jgi:hypothetical protein